MTNTAFIAFFLLLMSPLVSADQALTSAQLIKAIQGGGHIIYMRHGPTERSQKDNGEQALSACEQQRNLSNDGRTLAKKLGASLKQLNIPIGRVLSSPYCRCKDTAKLVFGEYTVAPNLGFSISKNAEESKALGAALHNIMKSHETTVDNLVLVGHTSNLREGLGVWPKPEAVMAIFENKQGEVVFKGMIKPSQWP